MSGLTCNKTWWILLEFWFWFYYFLYFLFSDDFVRWALLIVEFRRWEPSFCPEGRVFEFLVSLRSCVVRCDSLRVSLSLFFRTMLHQRRYNWIKMTSTMLWSTCRSPNCRHLCQRKSMWSLIIWRSTRITKAEQPFWRELSFLAFRCMDATHWISMTFSLNTLTSDRLWTLSSNRRRTYRTRMMKLKRSKLSGMILNRKWLNQNWCWDVYLNPDHIIW